MISLKDDLLSGAKAASDYLGLPPTQIYRLVANGDLPVIRKGRSMYFRKSELDAAFRSDAGSVTTRYDFITPRT